MEGLGAVMKVIEEGAFRAEVDVTNLNDVKIKITMTAPLYVSEYDADNEPWKWEEDIRKEAAYLRYEVNEFIFKEWKARGERENVCAAS